MENPTDRRARLLSAARSEFAEHGFAGARVARIADAAGVNKQLIFYYFGSKAGLSEAVETEAAAMPPLQAPSDPSGPATERLRQAVSAMFAALADRPALVRALVQPPGSTPASGPAGRALEQLEAELTELISEGQGLGYFRDDADPATVSRQAVVLCAGFLALAPQLRDPAPEQWVRSAGETLVQLLTW